MNNAKQFILNNSPKFTEAVENGLDIRMDEDEILRLCQITGLQDIFKVY